MDNPFLLPDHSKRESQFKKFWHAMVVVAVKQLRQIPLWDTEIFSQPAFVAVCLRHKILRRVVKFNLGFSFPLFRTFQYFISFHIAPFFRKTHFLEALKGPLFLQPSTTLLAHLQHAPFCLASSRPMKKQSRYFYLFSFIKLRNKKSDATKITCFSDKYKQSDTKKGAMPFMAPLSKKAEQDVILRIMAK